MPRCQICSCEIDGNSYLKIMEKKFFFILFMTSSDLYSVCHRSIKSVNKIRARPRFSEPPNFALYLSSGFVNCKFDSGPKIYDWKSIGNCKKKNKGKNKGIHSGWPANPGLTRLFLWGPSPSAEPYGSPSGRRENLVQSGWAGGTFLSVQER